MTATYYMSPCYFEGYKNECSSGHKLDLISHPINDHDYGNGTHFNCKLCKKKGYF